MHARAFAAVRAFSDIAVFSPTPASRERFASDIGDELVSGRLRRPAPRMPSAVRMSCLRPRRLPRRSVRPC